MLDYSNVRDGVFIEGKLQVRTYDLRHGEQVSVEIVPSALNNTKIAHLSAFKAVSATPLLPILDTIYCLETANGFCKGVGETLGNAGKQVFTKNQTDEV